MKSCYIVKRKFTTLGIHYPLGTFISEVDFKDLTKMRRGRSKVDDGKIIHMTDEKYPVGQSQTDMIVRVQLRTIGLTTGTEADALKAKIVGALAVDEVVKPELVVIGDGVVKTNKPKRGSLTARRTNAKSEVKVMVQ